MTSLHAVAVAVILAGAMTAGCSRSAGDEGKGGGKDTASAEGGGLVPQSTDDLSTPLATVDDVVITVKQLQDSINRQSPYIRARYASREQKRIFLDNMIRFEVLASEAVRRGLDRDPEVVQTMKSAMITKLLKAELAAGIKPEDIPEADLRAFFAANPARFNKAEEVRVSAIVLAKQKQADDVAVLARGEQGQSNKGFRDLVSRFSTDAESRLRGGDLRYFERDSTEVPKPVIEAAFALGKTGDVAGPIAAGKSFYIIKQTGRRGAVSKAFDRVKREIQNELYKQRREGAQRKFVDQLKTRSKVEVLDENLKKVRVDTSNRTGDEPSAPGGPSAAGGAQ
ncbi:MAG TPA: peptidyl-prolyl cis-trans isomerase [Kofleriaceae bacterium]|nr:peptidyl-prolyl cis-trans isomerase [Kofleriaceae bacterium]